MHSQFINHILQNISRYYRLSQMCCNVCSCEWFVVVVSVYLNEIMAGLLRLLFTVEFYQLCSIVCCIRTGWIHSHLNYKTIQLDKPANINSSRLLKSPHGFRFVLLAFTFHFKWKSSDLCEIKSSYLYFIRENQMNLCWLRHEWQFRRRDNRFRRLECENFCN